MSLDVTDTELEPSAGSYPLTRYEHRYDPHLEALWDENRMLRQQVNSLRLQLAVSERLLRTAVTIAALLLVGGGGSTAWFKFTAAQERQQMVSREQYEIVVRQSAKLDDDLKSTRKEVAAYAATLAQLTLQAERCKTEVRQVVELRDYHLRRWRLTNSLRTACAV